MPVKRMIGSLESMSNQWINGSDRPLDQIDNKCHSLETISNIPHETNTGDDKDSLQGYKSALNESVVDDLVSTLTNKLCLKTSHRLCRMTRLSPYQTNNSSAYRSQQQSNHSCYCLNCKYLISNQSNGVPKGGGGRVRVGSVADSVSDTYELMQQLLKEGSLIKEAVKRLQYSSPQSTDTVDDCRPESHRLYGECSDEECDQNENHFNLLNAT